MATTLPCPDGAGSINNADAPAQVSTATPYVIVQPNVGSWQMSDQTDLCAQNQDKLAETYVTEMININGAPLNVFKLLGVHEQGDGSIISKGTVFASTPAPGYPVSNITGAGSWRSLQTATAVAGATYIGVDFGIILKQDGRTEYAPPQPNWMKVGAVKIQQADTAINYARQVRVDTTDGTLTVGSVTGPGIWVVSAGPNAEEGIVTVMFSTSTVFSVSYTHLNTTTVLGSGDLSLSTTFQHPVVSFTANGTFNPGDIATIPFSYV